MTITYPRAFPFDGCFTDPGEFELKHVQTQSLTGSSTPNVADIAPARWVGSWSTRVHSWQEFDEWDAWLASLRGGLRLFKGRPNRHRWPRAFPRGFSGLTVGGNPFSGSGNLDVIGDNRDVVTIDALPANFALGKGDIFSIPVGSRQHLHRILEGGTTSGGAVTVTVEPPIRPGVNPDIAVLLDAPYCDMSLVSKSLKRDAIKGGTVTFEGQQALI